MTYYCHLDSAFNIENTNLQLYSLKKAAEEWNELVDLVNEIGIERVDNLKERLVFITNCFGLSLSQLLGQNSPSINKNRMDPPRKLFPILLKEADSDEMSKKKLKSDFEDFLKFYDAIRHFGKVKHKSIDKLNFDKLEYFKNMTIEIWDIVISIYRKDKKNNIEEFSSISDIIYFEKITISPAHNKQ